MKKLQFIIPNVTLLQIIFITLLFCFPAKLKADTHYTGCWIPGTNSIWYVNDLVGHPGSTNFLNDGVTGALNGIDDGYHDLDGRCNNGGSIPCVVYWNPSAFHSFGDKRGDGEMSEYSVDYCPIDDYIPALFIFTLLIAIFKMRNSHLINESKFNHRSL